MALTAVSLVPSRAGASPRLQLCILRCLCDIPSNVSLPIATFPKRHTSSSSSHLPPPASFIPSSQHQPPSNLNIFSCHTPSICACPAARQSSSLYHTQVSCHAEKVGLLKVMYNVVADAKSVLTSQGKGREEGMVDQPTYVAPPPNWFLLNIVHIK